MNSLEQYISEKLHLNKNNKELISVDDPTEFIESFKDQDEREWIVKLLSNCVKHVARTMKLKNLDDFECYVYDYAEEKDKKYRFIDRYGWRENQDGEHHKAGDILTVGTFNPYKIEILYVVTKDTIIPEKYKKYI